MTEERENIISKSTLLPIGLVITIIGVAFYFGMLTIKIENNSKIIGVVEAKVETNPNRIEFNDMKADIREIKADVKSLLTK